ncbi:head GIN domain-containing protein [Maribacter sp. 2307ULW6-5]|uniref:head GIN domain-containing protein n=1 Tax=Maribacter sp. 2307ULW6-5 TaxID=3386275 RepID=UPI0039BC24CE
MMKRSMLSLFLATTMVGCAQWGKTVKGNGDWTTVERSTKDYDALALSGWFTVKLVDGQEGALILRGESNLLEHLVTEVRNNTLTIKTKNGVRLKPSNWKDGIEVTVPVRDIEDIALSGSGDIVGSTTLGGNTLNTKMSGSGDITLDVDVNTLKAILSGSGDMELSGRTTRFEATVSGSGDIEAFDLAADHVEATVSGSADIEVTAKESLSARVSGSGDIAYKGSPTKVDAKTSGSGDITKY